MKARPTALVDLQRLPEIGTDVINLVFAEHGSLLYCAQKKNVGRGETGGYQHKYLLFPQYFKQLSYLGSVKIQGYFVKCRANTYKQLDNISCVQVGSFSLINRSQTFQLSHSAAMSFSR